ncbi:hypothetical protein ACFLZZ_00785 [Nanoarchaeota archaeon]
MKKIFILLATLVLASAFVLAQGQGIHEPGTGIENPELKAVGQGTGQGLEEGEVMGAGEGKKLRAEAGTYKNQAGMQMQLHRQENGQCRLEVEGVIADCPNNMTQEMFQNRTRLHTMLSNGRDAEIKVMPNTASETALQRLRLRNCDEDCQIELKEVGAGEQVRAAYEMKAQRNSKVFGLFRARMQVQAQVDAETGELIQTKKPWWAFLATEAEE